MKILITGGLGFQGSHLTEYFISKGHDVTVLNTFSERARNFLNLLEEKPRIVWGSVTDWELVRKSVREHDVVLHLAAYVNVDESIKNPRFFVDVNIGGTVNILEAAKESENRLIYASTCEVYGVVPGREVINEEAELRPHSPYAASKAAADRICFSYFKSYGLNVVIVRPFNIFGPRQKEGEFGALIPILVKKALDGGNLTVFGSGTQTRDYMYIDDLLSAYGLVLEAKNTAGEIFNFGTSQETAVKDIVEYIAEKFGVSVEHKEARSGEVNHFRADISKAKRMLGFKPKVKIWDGIDRYMAWRKAQS